MEEHDCLTERFQQHRLHLRAVAHRMLGSAADADEALQEAWLRMRGRDAESLENTQAWLTTVVARVCLNMLRARQARPQALGGARVPDPVVTLPDESDPEREAVLADTAGLALLVVLDVLSPAERLAFVLHDVFAVPFSQIAAILGRSEAAAQQLASRARRRVRDSREPDPDSTRQRLLVDAFFAASREGDFDALIRVLHPDVVLRIDGGERRAGASRVLLGADAVAASTRTYARLHPHVVPAVVNGAPGAVIAVRGRPYAVMAFSAKAGHITAIDALLDPERLERLELELPAP